MSTRWLFGWILLLGLATTAWPGPPTVDARYGHLPRATEFGMPVGWPDGEGYYDAQDFGVNLHLGEDWNGVGGGATDRGDPVHVMATGEVRFAEDVGGGWGKVLRVVHRVRRAGQDAYVESVYAHLDRIDVAVGDAVEAGQIVGTIGDADGHYSPHLHFELRREPDLPLGGGYSAENSMYLDPCAFLEAMGGVTVPRARPRLVRDTK